MLKHDLHLLANLFCPLFYKRDRGEAQDLGRNKNTETTREAYSHLNAEEQRERLDELVEEF